MRILKYLYLAVGIALLVAVISQVDVAEVATQVARIGPLGLIVILSIHFVAFALDTVAWQLTLVRVPLNMRWAYRTWRLRMVSEVFNTVLPAAGMGGEPMKAELLKKHYGIGYREGLSSIILAKTTILLALVLFLIIGFALMWRNDSLDGALKLVAAAGLAVFSLSIALFFMVQRWRGASLAGTWLARFRFARRLEAALHHIHDIDERLVDFYTRHTGRFASAYALAFVAWVLGAAEVYYAMAFLGHPVTLAEAWIIGAAAELVSHGTFFIPASIGAQEGAFLIVCAAITGSPSLGVAMAVVRRFREVLWLLWGGLLGLLLVRRPITADGDADKPAGE
ncbi:MAG: flippase-like domain-containing protein [Proteobacteria bacterium]|nr:flippase-like domain-containing protein [Pseudomonadota bacterium]